MEFRFELPQSYSTRDFVALNRLMERKGRVRRWITPLFRLCAILIGGSFVLSSLSWLDGGYVGETPLWVLVAIPLVIGLLWLSLGLFYFQIAAVASRRKMLKGIGAIAVILDEEGITERTDKGTAQYKYDGFLSAYDYQDRWFLFLDKHHAVLLPKNALTGGAAERFAPFWTEKTGRDIITIKSRSFHK